MRFTFIEKVCRETVVKPRESKEHIRSQKMDRILTGKYTAIPCFIGIMALVFWLTFSVIGKLLSDLLEAGIGWLTEAVDAGLAAWHVNEVLHSLVIDGIFNGVGSVLSSCPPLSRCFSFCLCWRTAATWPVSLLSWTSCFERSGCQEEALCPCWVGFGCTVPGVMASRTLPSERDRKMTILLTPFMSCSAKLPIYAFFAAAFFPEQGALVMIALYFGGILMGILMALLLRGTLFRGEAVPFVMELPTTGCPA